MESVSSPANAPSPLPRTTPTCGRVAVSPWINRLASAVIGSQQHPGDTGGQCDIGAFEFESASLTVARQTGQIVLSWTTGFTGYTLQSTPILPPASWATVTNPVVVVGTNYVVTNSVNERSRFYRLNR